jgi:hypothetical protein
VVAPTLGELGRVVDDGRSQFHARPLLALPGRAPPA